MRAFRIVRLAATIGVFVTLVGGPASRAATTGTTADDAQRVLTLLAAVGEEYREGVQDGQVVRPIEFEEAKAFLQDARQRFAMLGSGVPAAADLAPVFGEIAATMEQKAPPETVQAKLATLRERIVATTGVTEAVFPAAPPSTAHGRALFHEYCVSCHGDRGDGRGPNAVNLNPPPANFTDATFMHGETPYDFYHVISLGKRQSAMPAWDGVLSVQDRWDLIAYLWTLAPGAAGLAEGQGVYLAQCASCHGAGRATPGAFAGTLMTAVPDLTSPQALARRTDAELFGATTHGIAAAPMPAFARTLRDDERWKAVAFMRHLSLGGPGESTSSAGSGGAGRTRFAGLLRLLGQTYRAAFAGQLADGTEYDQARVLAQQVATTAMPIIKTIAASAPEAAEEIRRNVITLAEQVDSKAAPDQVGATVDSVVKLLTTSGTEPSSTGSGPAQTPDTLAATDTALAESASLLKAAQTAYQRGGGDATLQAADAYMQFEPLEIQLGAVDPGLKTAVEERFLHLRQLLRSPGNQSPVDALVAQITDDYVAVRRALQPRTSHSALFIQSAAIILREGFEVVLVISALLAYVIKTGNRAMRRAIYAGTVLGVAASLATAFAMDELLRLHPGSAELLEGMTMLLAAAVLFFVSYWLVSKSEADKWQRYIRSKVQDALTSGRSVALASAAFLAVYREGFETVLFYQALYASAPAASMTVTVGFGAGAVALLIVYALFRRFQVQIPIRQFFFVTGLLLYAMATIFAGQGIHELQEAGIVALTPVSWVPAIPLLGIYPSVQSLALQAVFVILLTYATAITLRRSRERAGTQSEHAVAELHALRVAIEALREELTAHRRAGPGAARDARLDGLLARVEGLARAVLPKALANGRTNGGRRNGH